MAFANHSGRHLRRPSSTALELDEKMYSISDLAREFNVSLRALRFYEDKGLLNPQRHGVARRYGGLDRTRLQMILKGKKLGFTLSEIHDMLSNDRAVAEPVGLALQPEQILSQIGHLERQRQDLDQAITELQATHRRLAENPAHAA